MPQYAVLSNIHANIWALEAVLADIAGRGLDQIINLGDTLYGPLEPQATAECLMKVPLVSIQGNQDRLLLGETRCSRFSNPCVCAQRSVIPQSGLAGRPTRHLPRRRYSFPLPRRPPF